MAELLLELFSEEIPARMQVRAADDLGRLVGARLADAGLDFGSASAYSTPRRLALRIDGLPAAQPDLREERRGPKVDAPEKAIAGFLRATGLRLEDCEQRETDKGSFLFAVTERKGQPTAEVLSELLPAAIAELPWPKSMRWGDGETRWVRPLHGLLALFDGAVVVFEFAGIAAGKQTRGHRFHAPDTIPVQDFADYREKLKAAHVILDPAERRQLILDGARALAAADGMTLQEDAALLDEVAGLVEWPVPQLGKIDARFMALPAEVLVTTMKVNQKYLALDDAGGKLAPRFITIANLAAKDGGLAIKAGNQYVLTARLADAEFFWQLDRKTRLEDRIGALDQVVFHAKLGSLGAKVVRIAALARDLADRLPGCDGDLAERAARLAKADLSTEMVGEFANLQGIMGRYYADHDGEAAEVSQAIGEHYSPQGPNDACPTASISIAVALADKIDTLAGFWAIDEKPTGSKDPYALRRAALGVIRLILENNLRLPLLELFRFAAKQYDLARPADLEQGLLDFFADRLVVHLRQQGVRHDLIQAIFALGGEDDLVRLLARVEALSAFVDTDDGVNLITAYRRAANILKIEEKNDSSRFEPVVDAALIRLEPERDLDAALSRAVGEATSALEGEDFAAAMVVLSRLRGPVDRFFDLVTVNADAPEMRVNRLKLLAKIRHTLHKVADFSHVQG